MHIATFQYTLDGDSWSVSNLPPLDSAQTLVLAFGATQIQTAPKVLQLVQSHYPNSHVLGCSTAGEILNGRLSDGTLAVAVVRFEKTALASGSVVIREPSQSRDAGVTLGTQLMANGRPNAILLLAEGLRVDHAAFLAGLHEQTGTVPIVGALAADSQRYEASWVWTGARLQSGLVGAVAFHGASVQVSASINETWGQDDHSERVVTKSVDNVVFMIGGIPATQVCVGANGLLPLRVLSETGPTWFASPLGANNAEESVVYNRRIPVGTRVQVVRAEPRHLIEGASAVAEATESAILNLSNSGSHGIAIATSSAGRRMLLGDSSQTEVSTLSRLLPPTVPLIGLYSYGEVSPGEGNRPEIHDAGVGVVLLSEEAEVTLYNDGRAKPPTVPSRPKSSTTPPPPQAAPKFVAAQTTASMVQMRPKTIEMGACVAACYDLGRLRFVSLSGTINETFRGQEVAAEMAGRVVLDLGGIELITSYGVRQWLEMLTEIEQRGVTQLYLAHCSEAVVNQMLMVRNFRGNGQIVSFGAPYICTACSATFEYVLDCQHAAEEIAAASPPDVACPTCGNRAVFDEDPELYLDFVSEDLGKALPFAVRNALAERRLEAMTEVDDAVEKRLEGDRTVFRINREVDEKIRWKRVLSGVEGIIRLDFSRSKGATDLGADRFLAAVRQEAHAVSQVILDQLPTTIVERMIAAEPIPKIVVRTITLPARCSNCGVVRQAAVDPAGIREASRRGLQPESECRRCSGSVPIALAPEIIAFFTGAKIAPVTLSRGINRMVWVGVGAAVLLIGIIAIIASM